MAAEVLSADGVRLGAHAVDKADAIGQCGGLLLALGAVDERYLPAMHERELSVSTYIGEEVAIPHGTDPARAFVKRTALAVIQFPNGVDWGDGNRVRMCVGIAADGDHHVKLLSALATALLTPGSAERLRTATEVATVLELLQADDEEMTA